MIKIITLTIILTGALVTAIEPIYLPNAWVETLITVILAMKSLDGILPIQTLLDAITWIVGLGFWIFIFNLVIGFISMFSGSGKPEA